MSVSDRSILNALRKDGELTVGRIAQRWPYNYKEVKQRLIELAKDNLVRIKPGPRGGFHAFPGEPMSCIDEIQIVLNENLFQSVKDTIGNEGVFIHIYYEQGNIIVEEE